MTDEEYKKEILSALKNTIEHIKHVKTVEDDKEDKDNSAK